jgi:radical SAM superfamily enzyme YgiQ (UPF0313 family)
MELAVREASDRFLSPGTYRALEARLRKRSAELAEIPAVVLSAFERSNRLLPFVLYDSRMFPAGARSVAASLHQAGFQRTRAVFQLWNPRFRPSRARIDSRPVQMLLISSMQIHARSAYEMIREAFSMGDKRPLIVAGGAKAMYEPYHFWSIPGDRPVAPDVVVTGESYVLLDLLDTLVEYRGRGETMRTAFERARLEGALETIPGLVYLSPEATLHEPAVVDTGLQRLVQHLDEMPHEVTGLSLLEPPHHGVGLSSRPIADAQVRRHAMIAGLQVTQGCKFTCSYCPIPAQNQKTWRFRSPEALAHEIRSVNERFGIKYFFGADDNFFNHRQTAEDILSALARATTQGRPLGQRIRFATEATQADTYKNRDLLPLARAGGLHSIWFGIEDLTATLINKGQKPAVTLELFRLMHEHKISPMAMIMYHDGQPFYTRDSLYGLYNQADFLRKAGAISLQCTAHTPAVGTAEYEQTYESGRVIERIGRYTIPEAMIDGNHVVVTGAQAAWKRQIELIGGYAVFYNPRNLIRAFKHDGSRLRNRRIGWQAAGFIAMVWTAFKILPYTVRLMTGKLHCYSAPPVLKTVPVREAPTAFSRWPAAPRMRARERKLASAEARSAEHSSQVQTATPHATPR